MIKFASEIKLHDNGGLYLTGDGNMTRAEALMILHMLATDVFHLPDDMLAKVFSLPADKRLKEIGIKQEAMIDVAALKKQAKEATGHD